MLDIVNFVDIWEKPWSEKKKKMKSQSDSLLYLIWQVWIAGTGTLKAVWGKEKEKEKKEKKRRKKKKKEKRKKESKKRKMKKRKKEDKIKKERKEER